MTLQEFYERILPSTGPYCLFRTSTGKHLWSDDLVELAQRAVSLGDVSDIYFATSSFITSDNRTQSNVAALKAFRLDLDAGATKLLKHGPHKVYVDQQAALVDLVRFSKEANLPPSIIVSSGEGLHVYYELDDSVDPGDWTPVAKSLQKLCLAHGLKVDSAVTADSARILRPIGTLHPNGKRVEVLKDTGKVYTFGGFAELTKHVQELPARVFDGFDSINAELGLTVQGPPKSIKKILARCENAKWAYMNQPEVDEPYWRAIIGLTVHTVEGLDAAHAMSSRHPDYSPEATEDKFSRWATGPSTCATLESCNPDACKGCRFAGKIKSPIVLGALTVDETEELPPEDQPKPPEQKPNNKPWDGHIPKGFDVIEHKGRLTLVHHTQTMKENEAGDTIAVNITIPVTHEIFWFGHWADAERDNDTAQFTLYRLDDTGGTTTFVMEQSLLASSAEFSKFLSGKGIHKTHDRRSLMSLEHYGKELAQQVKTQQRRIKVTDHFGLRNQPNGELVAVQGEYVIFPDGRIGTALLGPALQPSASNYSMLLPHNPRGEWGTDVWGSHIMPQARKHVAFLNKCYGVKGLERYQLAIALALAGPLMAFSIGTFSRGSKLTPCGLTVTLYSRETARGKTTAMKAAMLAYGNPELLTKPMDTTGATDLARMTTLSHCGTVTAIMDEMGDIEAKPLNALVKSIGNGNARIRLNSSGALIECEPWALTCLMATNRSQREIISSHSEDSDATQFRLLEINCDNMPEYDADARTLYAREWDAVHKCYGSLGAVYHLMMCRTGSDKLRTMFVDKQDEVTRMLGIDNQSGRFLHRGLATVLVLHELASKAGLFPFNLDDIIAAFKTAYSSSVEDIKDYTKSMEPLELLMDCLRDISPNTVVTHSESRRTGASLQYDEPLNTRVPDVIKARHVVDSDTTYVAVSAMRDWCKENKVRLNELVGAAKSARVIRSIYPCKTASGTSSKGWSARFNLTKSMRANTSTAVQCYCFNTNSLALSLGMSPDELAMETIKGEGKVVAIENAKK